MDVFQKDKSLAKYTTFKIGGPATYLAEFTSHSELKELLNSVSYNKDLPVLILSGGSNVLISDDGFAGVVLINKILGIDYEERADQIVATVGAGVVLDDFVQDAVNRGYWGIENLSHIPGSVGATPIQNVGAYGVEVSNCIEKVFALNKKTLEEKNFFKRRM